MPYEQIGENEPVCIADEVPFEIPESWEWVRLKYIATINPRNDIPDDMEVAFIPMPLLMDGYRNEHTYELKKWKEIKSGFTHFAENDIVVAKITPCFQNRKSAILKNLPNGFGAGTTELHVVRRVSHNINNEYLLWIFKSAYFIDNGVKAFSGTAGQQRVGKPYMDSLLIPLPPIDEQNRIVKKIREVMPFCSDYEKAYETIEQLNKSFPDQLKKSILQWAVQGKLVPQDPKDEPASELLEHIRAEKEQLIKAGKIKRDKHESVIYRRDNSHYEKRGVEEVCIDDEIPFDIPESWSWSRIGSLVQVNPRNNLPDELEVGFMPMTLLQDGFNNSHTFETRVWKDIKSGFTHFANGDVVLAKITPCFQNRKSAVLHDLPNGFGAGTTELHVLRDNISMLSMDYLLLICKTHDFISNGISNFSGTAGQQRVGKDFVSNYLIPIPPLNEQKRIVKTALMVISNVDPLFG